MAIVLYSNHDYSFNDAHYSKQKNRGGLTACQLALLDEMECGWRLYRNPGDFNWFLYKARHKPDRQQRKTVYGPTAESLIHKGILAKGRRDDIGILYAVKM